MLSLLFHLLHLSNLTYTPCLQNKAIVYCCRESWVFQKKKKKNSPYSIQGQFCHKTHFSLSLSLPLSLSNDDKVKFGASIQEQIVTESSIFIDAECVRVIWWQKHILVLIIFVTKVSLTGTFS